MRFCLKFIKYLANLPLAIFLLVIIIIFSIFGSLVEQEQSLEFYKNIYNQPIFGFVDYKFLLKFGLDHVFRTWWFVTLLLTFGLSLTSCTFLQQLPTLKNVRRIKLYQPYKIFTVMKQIICTPNGKMLVALNPQNYRVFQSLNRAYANKGLSGRIAPIIVHFSMLIILIGTIFASTSGFVAQELVPESEIFHIQNLLNNNIGSFVPHISGRINDFWILYNDTYTTRQFYTDFSLIDINGYEIRRETIYVNHPLKYQGLTFYQTDWDVFASRIQNDSEVTYQIPYIKHTNDVWLTWIPTQFDNLRNVIKNFGDILLNQMLVEKYFLYDSEGKMLNVGDINEYLSGKNINIKVNDLIAETGIQIKSDPGLRLIYFGFFVLIFSIFTSYQSYSQIWIWPINKKLNIVGISNRSKFDFELEILNLVLKL